MDGYSITADVYNYTTGDVTIEAFPMTPDKLKEVMARGEVMVDSSTLLPVTGGNVGYNLKQFNEWATIIMDAEISKKELQILSQTYLTEEIVERAKNGNSFTIIDFDEECASWLVKDFYSDATKGTVLFELGYNIFPEPVPSALVEYMDYARAYRDCEINLGIRSVTFQNGHYLVW